MNAAVAARVAVLELERSRPTPRLPKPASNAPLTPAEQAARRAELLAAVYGTTRRANQP